MNLDQFTGHTAGPWNTLQYGPVNVLAGRRMVATTGCYSSNVDTESVDAENEANARLIAAAPSILEYARKLESVLHDCEDYFDNRADADTDQDGYIPNEEMHHLTAIRNALRGFP